MIEGVVNSALEATISLAVQGTSEQIREVEAVIDTGFSESLTLPPALVAELDLPHVTSSSAILADGSEATFDVYSAPVLWDGRLQRVDVYVSDAVPLVGMRMLHSHSLYVEAVDGGHVAIRAIE